MSASEVSLSATVSVVPASASVSLARTPLAAETVSGVFSLVAYLGSPDVVGSSLATGAVLGGAVTVALLHCENSEVLLMVSVAVEVMTDCPAGTLLSGIDVKLALPSLLVVTEVEPIKVWPSPLPDESQA